MSSDIIAFVRETLKEFPLRMPDSVDLQDLAVQYGMLILEHKEGVRCFRLNNMLLEDYRYNPTENNLAYERGFIDGMQHQMESSVDKAVRNSVTHRDEIDRMYRLYQQACEQRDALLQEQSKMVDRIRELYRRESK